MSKIIKSLGVLSLMVVPFLVSATPGGVPVESPNAFNILAVIAGLLNVVIPILITLGVVYVIWGVIKYATAKESDEQAEARKTIISGVIALFVIVSIWGLVAIINSTFNINQGGLGIPTDCIPGTIIGQEQSGDYIFCQ
jgi:hypothetical protein